MAGSKGYGEDREVGRSEYRPTSFYAESPVTKRRPTGRIVNTGRIAGITGHWNHLDFLYGCAISPEVCYNGRNADIIVFKRLNKGICVMLKSDCSGHRVIDIAKQTSLSRPAVSHHI